MTASRAVWQPAVLGSSLHAAPRRARRPASRGRRRHPRAAARPSRARCRSPRSPRPSARARGNRRVPSSRRECSVRPRDRQRLSPRPARTRRRLCSVRSVAGHRLLKCRRTRRSASLHRREHLDTRARRRARSDAQSRARDHLAVDRHGHPAGVPSRPRRSSTSATVSPGRTCACSPLSTITAPPRLRRRDARGRVERRSARSAAEQRTRRVALARGGSRAGVSGASRMPLR